MVELERLGERVTGTIDQGLSLGLAFGAHGAIAM